MFSKLKMRIRNYLLHQMAQKYTLLLSYEKKISLGKLRTLPDVAIHTTFMLGDYSAFSINGNAHITIHEGVECRRFCSFLIYPKGRLILHKGVFLNNYCSVNCLGSIEIGEYTIIGEGTKLYDHNHRYEPGRVLAVHREEFTIAPIVIGKNCWIGSNVTILKGVSIGDNVIIGANSLIYKSIPSNSIVKHNGNLNIETMTH